MIVRNTKISGWQMVGLLAILRMFDLLTFVPMAGKDQENGAVIMLMVPLSLLLMAVAMVPAWLLMRKAPGSSLIDCAMKLGRPLGWTLAAILFLLMAGIAADTVSNFEFLLTSAVYPDTSSLFFIISLVAVCGYAAYVGLEPVARVNSILFLAFIGTMIFLSIAVLPDAQFVYLRSPFEGNPMSLARRVLSACFANFDVLAWLLLLPNLKGNPGKTLWGWLLATALLSELLILLVTIGLGDYARSQMFPFFALTSVAEFSIFQRLDSLHLILWTFIAFIKGSVYLYLASYSLSYLIPRRLRKTNLFLCCVAVAVGGGLLSSDPQWINQARTVLQMGLPVAVIGVLLPLGLLIATLLRRRKGDAK